jgi:hypothetical protein
MNSYDQIKGMLNTIRRIQTTQQTLREQVEQPGFNSNQMGGTEPTQTPQPEPDQTGPENEDVNVINNVEVEVHSEDSADLELQDEEKGKISQLIDDFRTEVSEVVKFGKLQIYPNGAKLDGTITDVGISFTMSTGDDKGVFISQNAMTKLSPDYLTAVNKLNMFGEKFSDTINDLLINRTSAYGS